MVYEGNNIYKFEFFDDWYVEGLIIDVIRYIDIIEFLVNCLELYKCIEFVY